MFAGGGRELGVEDVGEGLVGLDGLAVEFELARGGGGDDADLASR